VFSFYYIKSITFYRESQWPFVWYSLNYVEREVLLIQIVYEIVFVKFLNNNVLKIQKISSVNLE